MYKDKEKQKEANKLANAKYRLKQKGITPAIIKALVDPKKRAMLEYISADLNRKHLGDLVRYGINGPTFETIEKLLEVTA